MVQRLLNGDRAQRGASDAQHDKRVELFAHMRGYIQQLFNDFFLVVRKLRPAEHPRAALGGHVFLRALGEHGQRVHFGRVHAALQAEHIGHHVIYIQPDQLVFHGKSSFLQVVNGKLDGRKFRHPVATVFMGDGRISPRFAR